MTARCGPRPGRFDRREPLARPPPIAARPRRRGNFAAEHWAYRAADGVFDPPVAAPERPDRGVPGGGGGPRQLACRVDGACVRLPVSASARVAREWRDSAGSAGSGDLLPIPEGRPGPLELPRNPGAGSTSLPAPPLGMGLLPAGAPQHGGPLGARWPRRGGPRPAARMAARDAGGGGASRARGTNTPSVSSTARLVWFGWRGCFSLKPPGYSSFHI